MFALRRWTRAMLAALALAFPITPAFANVPPPSTAATKTTDRGHRESAEEQPPAGSPELGILMIIGGVVFLILMAWLFSRVGGEDETKSPDGSII